MLCNYLNDIYDKHIHIGLDNVERSIFSRRIMNDTLNLLYSIDTEITNMSGSIFFIKNNKILFELCNSDKKRFIICHYNKTWRVLYKKHHLKYDDVKYLLSMAVENCLELGLIEVQPSNKHNQHRWNLFERIWL